ncbi:hypothetical protein F5X97DRAFT_198143 [Nemania serpens]|nr:hypothetical protein F5X97DRAFT_198143 [Nemania serpens]
MWRLCFVFFALITLPIICRQAGLRRLVVSRSFLIVAELSPWSLPRRNGFLSYIFRGLRAQRFDSPVFIYYSFIRLLVCLFFFLLSNIQLHIHMHMHTPCRLSPFHRSGNGKVSEIFFAAEAPRTFIHHFPSSAFHASATRRRAAQTQDADADAAQRSAVQIGVSCVRWAVGRGGGETKKWKNHLARAP